VRESNFQVAVGAQTVPSSMIFKPRFWQQVPVAAVLAAKIIFQPSCRR
jgi:hypothetical protein